VDGKYVDSGVDDLVAVLVEENPQAAEWYAEKALTKPLARPLAEALQRVSS